MSMEMLTKIIEAVLTILVVVITTYVIPFLKTKYDSSELEKLREYIEFGVRCAEMYFDTEDGKAKKQYVLNYIKSVIGTLVQIDITDDQLDVMIEGIVQDVKYGLSDLVN